MAQTEDSLRDLIEKIKGDAQRALALLPSEPELRSLGWKCAAWGTTTRARMVRMRPSGLDPHFELSIICCAFLIADSSGALSFFRMSIVFCAEAVASFLLPSFA